MHGTTETETAARRRSKSHRISNRPPFECIALLLQGGGALGSYQAGVYEALAEADLHPNWIAGISIGAINSAIIVGNPPAERVAKLRSFAPGRKANPRAGARTRHQRRGSGQECDAEGNRGRRVHDGVRRGRGRATVCGIRVKCPHWPIFSREPRMVYAIAPPDRR